MISNSVDEWTDRPIKEMLEQTPEEVPIGTTIRLCKTKSGWSAIRFDPNPYHETAFIESGNIILALKKVIGIY